MGAIATIEDAIVQKLKDTFGAKLRSIELAPAEWDLDYLERALKKLPGAFVVYGGGTNSAPGSTTPQMRTTWSVVAAADHAGGVEQRTRGKGEKIGVYEILETAIPVLNNMRIDGIGSLQFQAWDNDLSMEFEEQRMLLNAIHFSLDLELPRVLDPATLNPFQTFHADIDTEVNDFDGTPEASTTATLEQ